MNAGRTSPDRSCGAGSALEIELLAKPVLGRSPVRIHRGSGDVEHRGHLANRQSTQQAQPDHGRLSLIDPMKLLDRIRKQRKGLGVLVVDLLWVVLISLLHLVVGVRDVHVTPSCGPA